MSDTTEFLPNDQVEATVRAYLAAVATGSADDVLALYADNPTLEDPVGAGVKRGRDEILAFYQTIESMEKTTELKFIRAAGGEAAFQFEIVTDLGFAKARLACIEHMVINTEGKIEAMRAWWNDTNLTME